MHEMVVLCVCTCQFVVAVDIDFLFCLWQECVNLIELYLSHNHISVMEWQKFLFCSFCFFVCLLCWVYES